MEPMELEPQAPTCGQGFLATTAHLLVIAGALGFAGNNIVTRVQRHINHHEQRDFARLESDIAYCASKQKQYAHVYFTPNNWGETCVTQN